jgi:glycosyltransferase involved in cell wall biosynthesis
MSVAKLPEITIVAHDVGGVGGMEQQITRLTGGLLEKGHAVTIVARSCRLDPHPRLRFVRVPAPRKPFALYYPWFMLAGSVALRLFGRGVSHTTGALVLGRSDLSTVHFCHHAYQSVANGDVRTSAGLGRRLNAGAARVLSREAERLCYRPSRCRRLVAVSEGVASELRRFLPRAAETVSVIPNGVDRARFRPDPAKGAALREELGLEAGELVALFVGGDWERKGLRHAIEALAEAPGWRLVVVGEGDRAAHGAIARSIGVEDRIVFAGRRPDTERFYAAADAFVLPTAYEAFPLVALEAAAAGVPLVCTPVNGVEELVTEGESGCLVERSGAAIGAALGRLGADAELRVSLSRGARAASARYGWEAVVDRYSDLYRSLAAAGGA